MSNRDPKRLIMDAALATFVEVGFDRAAIAQICARAGVSNGALFHYFPSKDAIGEALYLAGIASYQDGLLRLLEAHRGTRAARAVISAAVRHQLAWVEANRDLAWFMYERGRADWQPAHGIAVRKLNRATAAQIRDWIAPLAAAGAVRKLPLPVLAACVVGPAHFIARRWLSGMLSDRPMSVADALADAAWATVAPGRSRRPAEPRASASAARALESVVIEAACDACPESVLDDWTTIHMSVTGFSRAPLAELATRVDAVRVENDGRFVTVEIALIDSDGSVARRGHATCVRGRGA